MVLMKDLFFINGRLTWPPVILVVFLACADVALDVIWRAVSLPFASLMILGGIFVVAGLSLILTIARLLGIKARERPEAR
jgi:hypothetical protein